MTKYQHDYAAGRTQMYDQKSRVKRAERIFKLLNTYYDKGQLKNMMVLDVGSSTGIIDANLAKYFKAIVGIDIDKKAIEFSKSKFKKGNLEFKVDDAMKLSFDDKSFDIVICAQVYEHVPNPRKLFNEIYRVLKPGGICYLAALNKFWPWEPHYNLPFLSYLPKKIAHNYVSLFGRAKTYYETPESYWTLRKITERFKVIDYTAKILTHPKKYGYENITSFPKNIIAGLLSPIGKYFTPTFFWILVKPNK